MFDYSLLSLIKPCILFLGLAGNLVSLTVLLRKKLTKIGPRNIYRLLFVVDLFILMKLMHSNIWQSLIISSNNACKISVYFIISILTISPWLLVYISVEKFISIKYPAFKHILRQKRNQLVYFLVVIAFNFTYNMPILLFFEVTEEINSDEEYEENILSNITTNNQSKLLCITIGNKSDKAISYMDLVSRVIIPSLLMIISTALLLFTLFRSRFRFTPNYTKRQNRTLKRDVRLAISSILINIIYILLSLPVSMMTFLTDFLSNDHLFNVVYSIFTYLFISTYAINFFLIILTNSLFRNECKTLFKTKKYIFALIFIFSFFLTFINFYEILD